MKKIIATAVTALAASGLMVAGSGTAQAADCHAPGLCGYIRNTGNVGIGLIHNWGEGYSAIMMPGQNSGQYFKDTDGIYIGSGYKANRRVWVGGSVIWAYLCDNGPKSIKISDTFSRDDTVSATPGRC